MNEYRDKNGHFTNEDNDGGACLHNGGAKEYPQNTPYKKLMSGYDSRDDFKTLVKSVEKEEKIVSEQEVEALYGEEIKGVKGQEAVETLLKEKSGHIKSAFHRDDIGDIDLIWGNSSCGLCHIIERRNEQKIDIDSFLSDIADVIQSGRFRKKNNRGNFEFMLNNKIAVVSPELKGKKITFLLTAFKTHSKK